jgi:hypothetical protein
MSYKMEKRIRIWNDDPDYFLVRKGKCPTFCLYARAVPDLDQDATIQACVLLQHT